MGRVGNVIVTSGVLDYSKALKKVIKMPIREKAVPIEDHHEEAVTVYPDPEKL